MAEFKVGAPKARAVLAALDGVELNLAGQAKVTPGRRLHSVPSEDHQTDSTESGALDDGDGSALVSTSVDPGTEITAPVVTTVDSVSTVGRTLGRVRSWRVALVLLALPAFVAIWSGWVGLGLLTGFGPVHLLPGIADRFVINSAITLPIGVEAYAAFALRVWLSSSGTARARRFAKFSAIGALVLGAAGQVAYHLMSAAGVAKAPWPVTTLVSCLPVVVLGCAAGLTHLVRDTHIETQEVAP
jgi:hypothetical protein